MLTLRAVEAFEFLAGNSPGGRGRAVRGYAPLGGTCRALASFAMGLAAIGSSACGARTDPVAAKADDGVLDTGRPSMDLDAGPGADAAVVSVAPEQDPLRSPEPVLPHPEAVPAPPTESVSVVPDEPEPEPLPEECRLAPVEPELQTEDLEILGDLASADFLPPEDERWNWAGEGVPDPDWPYPSRPIWPSEVTIPVSGDDVEFMALAGLSKDELFVVGRRDGAALVMHFSNGEWADESAGALDALPDASEANSVSVAGAGEVWVTTPEGLLRSTGPSLWEVVEVPGALLPLGAVWVDTDGFGVVAGGSVATTTDGGGTWTLETRDLGFVAPGLAYSRSFVRVGGRGDDVAVVGRYGHLITRHSEGWTASTLFASDVAFTQAGQFMTTRGQSPGLFFRDNPETWRIYPLTLNGGLNRVWASDGGEVFAGGSLNAILHIFADGSAELLPSPVTDQRAFYVGSSVLYVLAASSLWQYELGDVQSSGVSRAAVVDEALLGIAPATQSAWGQSAASNFEPLNCVEAALTAAGAPAWQGELTPRPPVPRYGSCTFGAEREFSETAFSFTAPTTGTYRVVLDEFVPDAGTSTGNLQLAMRNGCEGWLIWGGSFVGNSPAVDIGLEKGQVILIEVWSPQALVEPVGFELSIY